QSKDLTAIEAASTELNAAWHAASEDMYKKADAGQDQPQEGDNQQNPDDNVTDVDYEEVKS
ncbi:MAG: hypothetical protein PHR79_01270, partial [Bacteroidales bacterium]|nr:hypothetical protein [Bacteroidales bacterium]